MTASKICAGLVGLGVVTLLIAVLLGPGIPGSYCIFAGIAALILAAAIFLLHVMFSLYREYRAS
jgi:hypothetical protein